MEIEADPALNLLVGANGVGKTSILEALHCLATGRSFRSGQLESLIGRGLERLIVSARIESVPEGGGYRLGFERNRVRWLARCDGLDVATLGELARFLAVLSFDPESHELVAGPAEVRRRLLDLALFHVEPDYLDLWRRYQRSLRQRNAALRLYAAPNQWAVWEEALANAGERLSMLRANWSERLQGHVHAGLTDFLPELDRLALRWRRGWDEALSLREALERGRERDRELGYTVAGPHRGDLKLQLASGLGRHELSRGQQKLLALSLLLATAAALREAVGWSPLILLDDLPSELDAGKQAACLKHASGLGSQLWVTGTILPAGLEGLAFKPRCFRIESGQVSRLKVSD